MNTLELLPPAVCLVLACFTIWAAVEFVTWMVWVVVDRLTNDTQFDP